MARSGFVTFLNAMARESAHAQREKARAERKAEIELSRQLREQVRQLKEEERSRKTTEKAERGRYIERRTREVQDKNEDLVTRIDELKNVLKKTLSVDDAISFASLRMAENYALFSAPQHLSTPLTPRIVFSFSLLLRSRPD